MPITINGSTGISGVDGSAATPAVIGSDADTGFVFSAGLISAGLNGVAARVPAAHIFRLNADLVGANVTTAQSLFGVGVTLAASTVYAFEALYTLSKTAGVTSHTIGLGFGGTATVNNITHTGVGVTSTSSLPITDSTPESYVTNAVTNLAVTAAIASATATMSYLIRGTISVNAAGTFIPQYTLSAAPGGAYSTVTGSYFCIYPIGASGANVSIGTWS